MRILSFFTAFLLLFSCGEDDQPKKEEFIVCGIPQSQIFNELEWLNEEYLKIADSPEINGIVLYEYEGEEVIEVQNSLYSSMNLHQYYCDGTNLQFATDDTFPLYQDYLDNRVEIGILFGTNIWDI